MIFNYGVTGQHYEAYITLLPAIITLNIAQHSLEDRNSDTSLKITVTSFLNILYLFSLFIITTSTNNFLADNPHFLLLLTLCIVFLILKADCSSLFLFLLSSQRCQLFYIHLFLRSPILVSHHLIMFFSFKTKSFFRTPTIFIYLK